MEDLSSRRDAPRISQIVCEAMTIRGSGENIIKAAIRPQGTIEEISRQSPANRSTDLLYICTFHHFFCASLDEDGAPTRETTILCPAFATYMLPQGYWGKGDAATYTETI